jgi:hypothetical protein
MRDRENRALTCREGERREVFGIYDYFFGGENEPISIHLTKPGPSTHVETTGPKILPGKML